MATERAHTPQAEPAAAPPRHGGRFARLPRRVRPDEMVEVVASQAPRDPEMGRDADADWMVRYSA
ncbi:hypothetical protein AB0910_08650 [Streptomyces sp. NPDC047002]|uniref:hypothetical protein n=1 Tax=Streptomyces sp. NPDC047002 TaxID=3155475 RepID=UPI0034564E86